MLDLTTYLITLADKFDKEGNTTCADAVDRLLLKTASLEKVAQYVGAIGYVLKQNRAMMNCIRKKRVASKGSMQDVVMSCLKEYQDGQDYHDTQWTSKYAEIISQKPNLFKTCHLSFLHDLGTAWDIETHINNVRTAAQIFKDNEVFHGAGALSGSKKTRSEKQGIAVLTAVARGLHGQRAHR